MDSVDQPAHEEASFVEKLVHPLKLRWILLRDRLAPLIIPRWIAAGVLLLFYVLRVWWLSGWYIVTYALGIYLLNQFVLFLMPQWDPEEVNADLLPTSATDEYKPFMRRLPEYRFWFV